MSAREAAVAPAKSRKAQPRRRVVPLWRRRPAIVSAALLVAAAGASAGWWFWQAEWLAHLQHRLLDSAMTVSSRVGFGVDQVYVVGRQSTPPEQLLKTIGVARGAPILAIDLEETRQRLLGLPWISAASVERVLPSTLIVRVVERRPVAIWQNRGRFAVIDERGQIVDREDIAAFGHLLQVVGEDVPNHLRPLLQLLEAEPDLRRRVAAAVWVGGRRWDLRLADGIDVRLPETDPLSAWKRLADYHRQHRLLDKPVRLIDLRFSDRLIVEPKRGEPGGKAEDGDA